MPAFHWHRCEECGRWWRHADNCRGNTAAHTCACGEECWVVAWPEEHGYEFTQEPPDSRPYQDCKAEPRPPEDLGLWAGILGEFDPV
jgi:hypothetical protein